MYESLALEHSSTVERAAEAIRQALFAGELAPGTPLREVAIAAQLGVGRSTVREALTLLTGEGLATRFPNRGVLVTAYDRDQVHDLIGARQVLEAAGAHAWAGAAERARADVRAALAEYAGLAAAGAPARAITEAHLVFHRAVVALTGTTRLVGLAEQLYAEIRLALAHLDRARGNAVEQVDDHRALLAVIERGAPSDVDQAVAAHLADAESSIVDSLVDLPVRTDPAGWEA